MIGATNFLALVFNCHILASQASAWDVSSLSSPVITRNHRRLKGFTFNHFTLSAWCPVACSVKETLDAFLRIFEKFPVFTKWRLREFASLTNVEQYRLLAKMKTCSMKKKQFIHSFRTSRLVESHVSSPIEITACEYSRLSLLSTSTGVSAGRLRKFMQTKRERERKFKLFLRESMRRLNENA